MLTASSTILPSPDYAAFRPYFTPYSVSLNHGLGWPCVQVPELGEEARREIISWLDLKIVTGRYSQLLVTELLTHLRYHTLDLFDVFDAIGALEGAPYTRPSAMKPKAPFRHPPLKGLWHKHYRDGSMSSLVKNIQNHWARRGLGELIAKQFESQPVVTEQITARLVHEMVVTGHEERARSGELTGEWIVFAKHDGIKYYLTLGKHGDDAAIAERVRQCEAEFPGVKLLES